MVSHYKPKRNKTKKTTKNGQITKYERRLEYMVKNILGHKTAMKTKRIAFRIEGLGNGE